MILGKKLKLRGEGINLVNDVPLKSKQFIRYGFHGVIPIEMDMMISSFLLQATMKSNGGGQVYLVMKYIFHWLTDQSIIETVSTASFMGTGGRHRNDGWNKNVSASEM